MTAPVQPDPLDALLALAEAAREDSTEPYDPDAYYRFEGALDPATVVGLIERVREAEAELRKFHLGHGPALYNETMDAMLARAEAAEQRVKELERRWAYVERTESYMTHGETGEIHIVHGKYCRSGEHLELRADAAEQRVKYLENDATLGNLYDEAQDEITDLRAELAAAEAREQALRDRVSRQADELEAEAEQVRRDTGMIEVDTLRHAHRVRALLSPTTADTEESDRG